ncbi:tRNA uridine(34) 5-carboxymethylaminomethyl modification radical SAM/GNAT enzyme Elp3 [bacterium]|nr:tRNA uridine(34) 5-carboxymethylaminomethyl modification radical SAM/GNAT enzyme Elp3 [bacterium]
MRKIDLKKELKKLKKQKQVKEKDVLNLQRALAQNKDIFPSKVEVLELLRRVGIKDYVKKKPIRSLSGVSVISVLTELFPCPGQCLYCPKEENLPQSYLSGEPAVERAKLVGFDPYKQVQVRIRSLERQGHPVDKIELIVIGGTWSALPSFYQYWFIRKCFESANEYDSKRKAKTRNKFNSQGLKGLIIVQKKNEKAKHRIVGLTLETRPDWIEYNELVKMRVLGCTRVEIGIQFLDDNILRLNKRGHCVKEIVKATELLKNAGFKVCYHFMPGLFGSNPDLDLEQIKKMFQDPRFRPDMLKIYPCVVVKGSALYKLYQNGKFSPYSDEVLIELIAKMKKFIPYYVRVQRVFRDIPSNRIDAGSKISNLRQVVQQRMANYGWKCRCIRCREPRDLALLNFKDIRLIKREYEASNGQEYFLSFEDVKRDKILAFIRLRLPFQEISYSPTLKNKSKIHNYCSLPTGKVALIREIHTYGQLTPLGERLGAIQHYGFGKKLVHQSEEIARKNGYKTIAVISGVGVRDYWRSLGYRLSRTYMVKNL